MRKTSFHESVLPRCKIGYSRHPLCTTGYLDKACVIVNFNTLVVCCVSFLKLNIYLSIYFDERQKENSYLYIYHVNIVQF